MEEDLQGIRRDVVSMAGELFEFIGVPFEQSSELQRQVLAAFAFGMIFALGKQTGLRQPEVHALLISSLMDVFRYSDGQAVDFSSTLIEASRNKTANPTMHAIIHRGIDGRRQWQQKDRAGLKTNLVGILQTLGAFDSGSS